MKALTCALCALALALPALADDGEAKKHLEAAQAAWSEPEKALEAINRALDAQPSGELADQCKLFKASVLQELGEIDEAEAYFSELIRKLGTKRDKVSRVIKGEAMSRKARILFANKNDTKSAVQLLVSSLRANPNPATADMASVLYLRLHRMPEKYDEKQRAKWLKLASEFNEEALRINDAANARRPEIQAKNKAKFELQAALILLVEGKQDEAKAKFGAIPPDDLSQATLYQEGLFHALLGEEEEALAKMKEFLESRTTPRARNLARAVARGEPDLAEHLQQPAWQELFGEDEKVRRHRD
ncbi:MAG: hypothetical protein R3F62_28970 [Planctomycetota bacterium]